jgi:predicted DNA-binding transcriptional regulator AlpA
VPEQDADPYLDTEAVAEAVGVTTESIRVYLKRSRRRLRAGHALRPQDLPLPDVTLGRSPAWRTSTITDWSAHRVGPGRPTTP